MKEELSVIGEDGKPVDYIVKSDAVARETAIRSENSRLKEAIQEANDAAQQAKDRLTNLRITANRILSRAMPAGSNWSIPLSNSDYKEIRSMLDFENK
jgi:hypothetical protein